jgi:hypothetical protein
MMASRTLGEWDQTFVANVARDGRVLFARGRLPTPFFLPAVLALATTAMLAGVRSPHVIAQWGRLEVRSPALS